MSPLLSQLSGAFHQTGLTLFTPGSILCTNNSSSWGPGTGPLQHYETGEIIKFPWCIDGASLRASLLYSPLTGAVMMNNLWKINSLC